MSILVASFASDNNKHRLISFTFFDHLPPSRATRHTHRSKITVAPKGRRRRCPKPNLRPRDLELFLGDHGRYGRKVHDNLTCREQIEHKLMFVKRTCILKVSVCLCFSLLMFLWYWHFISFQVCLPLTLATRLKKRNALARHRARGSPPVALEAPEFQESKLNSEGQMCCHVVMSCPHICQCAVRHLPGWSLKLFHDVP